MKRKHSWSLRRKANMSPFRSESKSRKSPLTSPYHADRFIPSANGSNVALQEYKFASGYNEENEKANANRSSAALKFQDTLAKELFNGDTVHSKVLKFKRKPKQPKQNHVNTLRVLYSANREAKRVHRKRRYISTHPERILDAPEILDDYYINVLDWSKKNVLGVGLGNTVYLWNASTQEISTLVENESEENAVTSLRWMRDGTHIAVGTTEKTVQIWDVERQRLIRTMEGHYARIGALSWNNHVLSSGSRDSMIINHDVRVASHSINCFSSHTEEICGLTWSPDGTQLASGGNDNKCFIWEMSSRPNQPRWEINDHKAAVKALAWSPFQRNLLATGAGTADRNIRFYNTSNRELVRAVPTNSQVCSLQWSRSSRELISAHGFSQNQITLWEYPHMSRTAELTGHTARVLHTALSPDGSYLCSAAADETLQFWRVFDPEKKKKPSKHREKRRLLAPGIR